jgi:DUF4097 and DUF4098 domain-containing protein YvlB
MKSLRFYFSLSLFLTMLLCIPPLISAKAEDRIEKTYTLDRDGKVYLENISGDVAVDSWNKNEIKIIAHKVSGYKADLDNVTIDIDQTDGNIRIITKYHETSRLFRPTHVSVYYVLFIPDKAHLRLETVSGRVKAREIGGFLDIRTVSGEIEVVTAKNGVRCRTVSGDIHLEEIAGNADLKTTSGKIEVKGIKGSVKGETVSGNIELEALSHAEEVEVESISGSIKLHAELSPGGIYELNSHSGNIKISIPSDSNFELRVETFSGDIQCDFELKISGKIDRKKLRGVVGKGDARLILSSFSGNIQINKR